MPRRSVLGVVELEGILVQPLATILCLTVVSIATGQTKKVNYRDHVRPLFVKHCTRCHNSTNAKGDLDLSSYSTALAGGSSGEVLIAQDAVQSRLYRLINHLAQPHMPRGRRKLPAKQIKLVQSWIVGGLLEDPGSKPRVSLRKSVLKFAAPARRRPKSLPKLSWPTRQAVRYRRPNPITALAAHPWKPWCVVGGNKQVLLFEVPSLKLLRALPFPDVGPTSLRFSRDGRHLIGVGGRGGESGLIVVWDTYSGTVQHSFDEEEDTILDGDYLQATRTAMFGSAKRFIGTLQHGKSQPTNKLNGHTDWISALAIDPSGKWLASGDRAGGALLWDLKRSAKLFDLRGHQGPITAINWRRDGRVLATSSDDGSARLWVASSGKLARGIIAHEKGALDIEFTHNGRFVTGGRDRQVKLWDQFGDPLKTFPKMPESVTCVAVSNDGKSIIAGDFAGNVYCWSMNGKVVGRTTSHPSR